jgi:RNA recognition motif-containing protein
MEIEGSMTMMICNLPCRLCEEELASTIHEMGFGDNQFVHMPSRHYQKTSNLGYAFVHFSNIEDAQRFREAFFGFQFRSKRSQKKCIVKPAHLQGFNAQRSHHSRDRAKEAAFPPAPENRIQDRSSLQHAASAAKAFQ